MKASMQIAFAQVLIVLVVGGAIGDKIIDALQRVASALVIP